MTAPRKQTRVYSDYDKAYKKRPKVKKANAERSKDRSAAEKRVGKSALKGKDVHHPRGAGNGGPARIISKSTNRAMK